MSAERLHIDVALAADAFRLSIKADIAADRTTAVFGASGAGKSTLLRAIAGFLTPERGRIAFGAETWFDSAQRLNRPVYERPVGFMFQDARLFPHITVVGNLDYADRRSAHRPAAYSRTDIIDALDLSPLMTRDVEGLSGGERQRVALGRTLLTRPRLLLLDEPLSGLDHARKADILPYLSKALKRFAIPALYVSHDVEEVVSFADDVVLLGGGAAHPPAPAREALSRYMRRPFTDDVEPSALIEGETAGHDAALALTHVRVKGERISIPLAAQLDAGSSVLIRIKSRDVALALEKPEGLSIRNILPGVISDIDAEADGAFADVTVDIGAGKIQARLTRAAVADLNLRPGLAVFALVKTAGLEKRL